MPCWCVNRHSRLRLAGVAQYYHEIGYNTSEWILWRSSHVRDRKGDEAPFVSKQEAELKLFACLAGSCRTRHRTKGWLARHILNSVTKRLKRWRSERRSQLKGSQRKYTIALSCSFVSKKTAHWEGHSESLLCQTQAETAAKPSDSQVDTVFCLV